MIARILKYFGYVSEAEMPTVKYDVEVFDSDTLLNDMDKMVETIDKIREPFGMMHMRRAKTKSEVYTALNELNGVDIFRNLCAAKVKARKDEIKRKEEKSARDKAIEAARAAKQQRRQNGRS